jgi:hypothetical protein
MIITTFIHTLTRVNPCWPSQPVTWALSRLTTKMSFKTMIITIFIFTLTWVNLNWPSWSMTGALAWVDHQIKAMIIITFILCWSNSTRVGPPNTWLGPYPRSTLKLGFKIMIIIIHVLILTRVNDQPHSWLKPCLRSTLELSFKTMIIIIFIFIQTWVNPIHNPGFAPGQPSC